MPIELCGLSVHGGVLNNPTEEILTLCAVGITACKYLSKGQHEDITLASSVIAAYLPTLYTLVKSLLDIVNRWRVATIASPESPWCAACSYKACCWRKWPTWLNVFIFFLDMEFLAYVEHSSYLNCLAPCGRPFVSCQEIALS